MAEIRISARALAEYIYRSGDIETGINLAAAMQEGTKTHQSIQALYKETDRKEVPLSIEVEAEGIQFLIDGRCDGLLEEDGQVIIDEIKSTSGSLEEIQEHSFPAHWAQAKCYAFIVASEMDLGEIAVRLTYVQRGTYELKVFQTVFSRKELDRFISESLKILVPFARMKLSHAEEKIESSRDLGFPFSIYRAGQRQLAGAVYRCIQEGRTLFANAPTGIGKTISTLFPSIKAIGEGVIEHIFYITARTTTRKAAEEALALMSANGLHLSSVTITAKDKMCFREQEGCPGTECEYAKGYYDRINGAILDIMSNEQLLTKTVIEQYARKHRVCPFEYSLDLAYQADVIICDYNYIYDPRVSLKRLFDDKRRKSVLLVDEAHNLPDRGREMFSASLEKSVFLALKRFYKNDSPQLSKAAGKVNQYFIDAKKAAADRKAFVMDGVPQFLIEAAEEFSDAAEREIADGNGREDVLLDAYYSVQKYLKAAGTFNEQFASYLILERGEVSARIFCLDPSSLLKKAGKGFKSKIFFSATLVPADYFREMLGGEEEDWYLSVPSPFSSEQADVFIRPLSTRYGDREASVEPIAELISTLVEERPGNYICFFPSYSFMEEVHHRFNPGNGAEVIIQSPQMSEEDRELFLGRFEVGRKASLIGFAVMGGIFSEGIDLPGDKLNGVVIAGVGLPQLSFERDLLKQYYNQTGRPGYDYAYAFPGMVKVLQAGGRLIRSEVDTGTIVLIDDRFLHKKYLNLFPGEWNPFTVL